ncbi:transcriptional regulator LytR [Compostibacillus humi]|uniref:Polyisoprenyl-teichoic acid--peptidoglycan teichoic acid transferase TagU n=1 Tax=Compostibacillus humi TaxID=1245525 RepID=A0A8J2ZS35_9BACI|nr:LCP family protein [Compostibacillus humi]GGH74158.1 transcriptional regulator LytR [Compostibacillus humi]HLT56482.1 LCP family protein [Bacillota bacterium]
MVSRMEKKRNKKRKWVRWLLGIVFALFLIAGGVAAYVWTQLGSTIETMHNPFEPAKQKEVDERFKKKDSINMLLLGVDEREGDRGRSDTMILLSLNPNTDSMLMMSIPRDTYVNIPGRGMDKINHAYAFGGVDLSVQTVEETFDIPIHVYGRVNMEGFQKGIDAIGGVTVQNEFEFSQGGHNFPVGEIHLDGKEALEYIRMRKNDPQGDFGRNERQRAVIAAAIDEAASFTSITKFADILEILGTTAQTNLDMKKIQTLFTDYLSTRKNIKQIKIEGSGQKINGIYYYVVPDEEFSRVTSEIKAHMDE